MTPKQGPGQFQWSTGGWYGTQVGSTLWIFLLAATLFPKSTSAGVWTGICALAPNILGCILWMSRRKLAPYPALQMLIGIIGLFALLAMLAADHWVGLATIEPGWRKSPVESWWVLCIFPAMMVWFALMERAAVKRNKAKGDQSTALLTPSKTNPPKP